MSTWNVRTLYQSGKLDNVKQEIERLKINILGICETRWKDCGELKSEGYRIIYAGGNHHERGVGLILDEKNSKTLKGWWALSDRVLLARLNEVPFNMAIIVAYASTSYSTEEEVDKFYETLELAKGQCKSQDIIIMGDINAKVGSEPFEEIVGKYGLGIQNDREERWVQWCKENDQVITNTWFKQHPRRCWTWKSLGDQVRNQINYITICKRFRNAVMQAKSYSGADCGSDHIPVICNLQVKLRTVKTGKSEPRRQKDLLIVDQDTKGSYVVKVQNRFAVLEEKGNTSKWNILKEAITTTAKAVLSVIKQTTKQSWMTQEILDDMRERQLIYNRESVEYQRKDREIKLKCKKAKEDWLQQRCKEIERTKETEPYSMFKQIKEVVGRRACSFSGCIKAKDGTIIMD